MKWAEELSACELILVSAACQRIANLGSQVCFFLLGSGGSELGIRWIKEKNTTSFGCGHPEGDREFGRGRCRQESSKNPLAESWFVVPKGCLNPKPRLGVSVPLSGGLCGA